MKTLVQQLMTFPIEDPEKLKEAFPLLLKTLQSYDKALLPVMGQSVYTFGLEDVQKRVAEITQQQRLLKLAAATEFGWTAVDINARDCDGERGRTVTLLPSNLKLIEDFIDDWIEHNNEGPFTVDLSRPSENLKFSEAQFILDAKIRFLNAHAEVLLADGLPVGHGAKLVLDKSPKIPLRDSDGVLVGNPDVSKFTFTEKVRSLPLTEDGNYKVIGTSLFTQDEKESMSNSIKKSIDLTMQKLPLYGVDRNEIDSVCLPFHGSDVELSLKTGAIKSINISPISANGKQRSMQPG